MVTVTPLPLLETKISRTAAGRLIGEVSESSLQNANKLLLALSDLPAPEANTVRKFSEHLTTMSRLLRKISRLSHHE
jgi:hypothetical protein